MVKGSMVAIPKRLKIIDKENKNDLILKINDGYFSEFMIKKILKFQFKGNDEDGKKFAESFIAAGINIDKEIFIELYRKMTNQ
jgi:hypothetical protein